MARAASWTREQVDWLWLHKNRFPDKFCAEQLGRTEQAIRHKFLRLRKPRVDLKRKDGNVPRETAEAAPNG